MPKIHICPHPGCGKQFDRKYNLKCHRRIHSDEKPYLCSHTSCTRAFRWKSSLNHHLMSLDHASPLDRAARKSASLRRTRTVSPSSSSRVTKPRSSRCAVPIKSSSISSTVPSSASATVFEQHHSSSSSSSTVSPDLFLLCTFIPPARFDLQTNPVFDPISSSFAPHLSVPSVAGLADISASACAPSFDLDEQSLLPFIDTRPVVARRRLRSLQPFTDNCVSHAHLSARQNGMCVSTSLRPDDEGEREDEVQMHMQEHAQENSSPCCRVTQLELQWQDSHGFEQLSTSPVSFSSSSLMTAGDASINHEIDILGAIHSGHILSPKIEDQFIAGDEIGQAAATPIGESDAQDFDVMMLEDAIGHVSAQHSSLPMYEQE